MYEQMFDRLSGDEFFRLQGSTDWIPCNMADARWVAYAEWQRAGNVPTLVRGAFDADDVNAECRRRIYTIASQACQSNMTAARAAGTLDAAGNDAFLAGLQWIENMRAACASLIAAQDTTFANDAHWPACPSAVQDLAARF